MVDQIGTEVRAQGDLARHADPPPQGRHARSRRRARSSRCGTATGAITHFVGVAARHHRGAAAARSAGPQRAAVGRRRAGRRRRARDQQPAADDHRLRRADDRGAPRHRLSAAISRSCGRRRRAPGRSSATCWRSSAGARPIARRADLNQIVRATARAARAITSRSRTSRCTLELSAGAAAGARQPRGDPADRPEPGAQRRAGDAIGDAAACITVRTDAASRRRTSSR